MSGEPTNTAETRLGKGMLYLGWILVLAVLVLLFADVEESKSNPNRNLSSQSNTSSQVVLQKNDYGQYVFTGLANGIAVDFLVDTGASSVVFTEKQAEALGLTKGLRQRVITANGDIWVYNTRLEKLQIGSIELRNVPAAINPHMEWEALLGMTALGELEWHQSGDQLTIKQLNPP